MVAPPFCLAALITQSLQMRTGNEDEEAEEEEKEEKEDDEEEKKNM